MTIKEQTDTSKSQPKIIRRKLLIGKKDMAFLRRCLTENPKSKEEQLLSEYDAEVYLVDFGKDSRGREIRMEIKICGTHYEAGCDNTAWTEAVLFADDVEMKCTDVFEDLDDSWDIELDGVTYITEVAEGDFEDSYKIMEM